MTYASYAPRLGLYLNGTGSPEARRAALSRLEQSAREVGFGDLIAWPEAGWAGLEEMTQNVLSTHPDWQGSVLRFEVADVPRGAVVAIVPPEKSTLIFACAVPLVQSKPDFSRVIAMPHGVSRAAPADVRLFQFWQASLDDLDWLGHEVVTEWLRVLNAADDLGVAGIVFPGFLSAPKLLPRLEDAGKGGANAFPWSPMLPDAFRARHGYELVPHLPALIADTGAEATRVRQHFWETISHLARENFWAHLWRSRAKQQETCAVSLFKKEPQSLHEAIGGLGDVVSACRASFLSFPSSAQGGPVSNLAASLRALDGKEATVRWRMDGDWSLTLGECLPAAHHLLCAGFTRFIVDEGMETLRTRPGSAEMPHAVNLQPFWPGWKQLSAYLTRCGHALAQGRPGARIGVLFSQRSGSAHWNPKGHRFTRWVWEDLQQSLGLLHELHFDYVLVSEDDVHKASIEDGRLVCGKARLPLEMIVVPGASTMERAVWEKLEAFVGAGGKVACLGLLPRWSENGRDIELEERIGKVTLVTVADLYEAYALAESAPDQSLPTIGYPVFKEDVSGGRLCCYQPRLNPDQNDATLRVRQILKESLAPDLETQTPGILYTRRIVEVESDSGDLYFNLYFIFNTAEETQHVKLRLRPSHEGVPQELDPWTGEPRPIAEWMAYSEDEGGGLVLELSFAPQQARLIWIAAGGEVAAAHVEHSTFEVESFDGQTVRGYAAGNGTPRAGVRRAGRLAWHSGVPVAQPAPLLLPEEWQVERRSPNVLLLDAWQSQAGRHAPGAPSLPEVLSDDARTLRTTFGVDPAGTPASVFWCWPSERPIEVFLNNVSVAPCPMPFPNESMWSDTTWQWFDLGASVAGENVLLCVVENFYSDLVARAPLVGDFNWNEAGLSAPGPLFLESGSWHEQGLPFFCGALDYVQNVAIPTEWQRCRIFLELSSTRDMVQAWINGVDCGTLLAPPWQWDVTSLLHPSTNAEIRLRAWNTAQSLWHPENPVPSGLLGPVRLVAYPIVEIEIG